MTAPVLRLESVSKRFLTGPPWRRSAVDALHPVSLALGPGETIAVVGESGSGKTTLARLCLGLLRPTSGTLSFEGAPPRPGARRSSGRMAAVLQNPASSLNPRMTISAAIEEPMRIGRSLDRDLVGRLLRQVGLSEEFGRRFPRELSGGQQQRVAIARALAASPALVVFDEAVSALDVSVQAQILNLIRDLADEKRFACLFITHDISVARYVADRAIVMQAGRIVDEIEKAGLYGAASHPYTRRLQAASGLLPGVDETNV